MDTKQPEALRLANMLEKPGYGWHSTPAECAAELQRLQSENDTLRAGYDAARLEIESLQAQAQQCGAGAGCCAQAARIEELEAQLEAVGVGGAAPDGWQLVPVEPTKEMAIEAYEAQGEATSSTCKEIYRAMLAAAPQPAAQAQEGESGWLRSEALLYRLTDDRRQENFDEIQVTMANGSRDIHQRSAQAERLQVMLAAAPQPAAQAGWCDGCSPDNCRGCMTSAAPAQAGEYPAGTGNPEADRIIGRLASSDPDFDDCADAVALIHKLVAEIKGPDGFDAWKDAAIADRAASSVYSRSMDLVRVFWQQHTQADALSMTMAELHADAERAIRAARSAPAQAVAELGTSAFVGVEPVGEIRASSELGVAPYADIWSWLQPGCKLYTADQVKAADSVLEDALRYRWLRINAIGAFRTNDGRGLVSAYHLSKIPAIPGIPEETDAAIDAAIAAQQGEKHE